MVYETPQEIIYVTPMGERKVEERDQTSLVWFKELGVGFGGWVCAEEWVFYQQIYLLFF
jgi:hypothetical protein